jgi:hypothetical protein
MISLEGFDAYLAERRLADDRHRPHLVRWARRFLQGAGADRTLAPEDRKSLFLEGLEADARLEEWQRRQAANAVDLYLDHYLPWAEGQGKGGASSGKGPSPSASARAGVSASHPPACIERARELLRLRHYSYRTERSYIQWAERFEAFCRERNLPLPGTPYLF